MKENTKLLPLAILAFFSASVAFAEESETITSSITVTDESLETLEVDIENQTFDATTLRGVTVDKTGSVDTISGKFINNTGVNDGVSIKNESSSGVTIDGVEYGIGYIDVDFIGNSSTTDGVSAAGIYNTGYIYSVDALFALNSIYSGYGNVTGVILNTGTITNLSGDFVSNTTTNARAYSSAGYAYGTVYNTNYSTINYITADFYGNSTVAKGSTASGALNNDGTVDSVIGDFMGNSATATGGTTTNATGTARGAAITNTNTIYEVSGDFIANWVKAEYNNGSVTGTATGGAIYNSGTIGFLASDDDMTFAGNTQINSTTVPDEYITVSNAIYNTGKAYFNAYDGYEISVNDGISGTTNGTSTGMIYINKNMSTFTHKYYSDYDSYSTVSFNNNVSEQTVEVYNGTLNLGGHDGGDTYTWTTYEEDTEADTFSYYEVSNSYTTEASIASLTGTKITVSDGATLQIGTTNQLNEDGSYSVVVVDATSDITLSSGSKMLMDSFASLSFESGATFTYDGATFVIDLTDFESNEYFSYDLFTFGSEDEAKALLEYLGIEGNLEYTSVSDYVVTLSLSGASIVITNGTAVPEPSTYAMIFGVIALGFAAYRRRK